MAIDITHQSNVFWHMNWCRRIQEYGSMLTLAEERIFNSSSRKLLRVLHLQYKVSCRVLVVFERKLDTGDIFGISLIPIGYSTRLLKTSPNGLAWKKVDLQKT